MDEFNKIRKAFFQEGLSINEIARKFKRSWETVDVIERHHVMNLRSEATELAELLKWQQR